MDFGSQRTSPNELKTERVKVESDNWRDCRRTRETFYPLRTRFPHNTPHNTLSSLKSSPWLRSERSIENRQSSVPTLDLKQEAEHWICPENALLRGLKALTNGVSKAITRGFRNQDDQPSVHLTRENPLDNFSSRTISRRKYGFTISSRARWRHWSQPCRGSYWYKDKWAQILTRPCGWR